MNDFKAKTIEHMQYFVGKVCTIFTPPINREFDELRSREHFVVKIEEINSDGIWGTHPYRGTVSFFPISYLTLIQEEQLIDPNNPEHQQMIKEYEKKSGKKVMSDVSPNLVPKLKETTSVKPEVEASFVDVAQLTALAKETKRSYTLLDIAQEKLKN